MYDSITNTQVFSFCTSAVQQTTLRKYQKEMAENLTVTVHKAKDLRIDRTAIPEPKEDEVLIKMDSVGICGSDVHFWQDGGFGELIVKTPTAMGHEGAGIVERY